MTVRLPLIQLIGNSYLVVCMTKMIKMIMKGRTEMTKPLILLILNMIRGDKSVKCNVRQVTKMKEINLI